MEPGKAIPIRLFNLNAVETKDEFDEKYERCQSFVGNIIKSAASETEAHDNLMSTVCKSATAHEEVCIGLLISVLVDGPNSSRYYRDLTYVSRDGQAVVIMCLNQLVLEKYSRLYESCKTQLIWLLKEMIKTNINGVDNVIFNLSRQIPGGDISAKSLWLADNLVDLLIEHRLWLEKNSLLVATAVYTYLRLIVDHFNPNLKDLRQKEVDFTISLLREKFVDCMVIGRDLVRLLQNVAKVPEFELLWQDLQKNPSSLSTTFTGITQLMQTRTSRRFLQCRLTPEMERKVVFLTSQVKFGHQKRYQDWFQRQYLATPESQSLRCDLIRFICGVIHPSNELLCSDIIPRWAIIGWILSSCTSNVAASNAKLSLFYDWLFYDPERDNIMNIEPAILVMYHSMRSHPVISVTLLDFLCRILPNFCPSLLTQVRSGIHTALHQITEKRVLAPHLLALLFEGPKLDRELRNIIKETFPEFCSLQATDVQTINLIGKEGADGPEHVGNRGSEFEARFSDDDSEDSQSPKKIKKVGKDGNGAFGEKRTPKISSTKSDSSSDLGQLSDVIKKSLLNLQIENDKEARCEIMEKLIQQILEENEFDPELNSALAIAICSALQDDFTRKIFPANVDEESLEDSIGSPLFVIFRNLCQAPEDDPSRVPILLVLAEMASQNKSIGYLILYFMKVSKTQDVTPYKEFAKNVSKDLSTSLLNDLRSCQEDDVKMFCFIIPDVYRDFESTVISNSSFMHLTVSCIDASQLQDLICNVLQGDMRMLKKETIVSIINASLEWETFEQFCLWQLISAHNIAIESMLPALPKLEFHSHSEALTNILLLLRRVEPAQDILKHVLNRDVKQGDSFVVSVLKCWIRNHDKKLAEYVASHLNKSLSSPAKRGAKRNNANKAQLNAIGEQVLSHLDSLRQKSKLASFFNHENIQSALSTAQSACTEAQKTKFSDLFALMEQDEPKPKRGKNAKAGSKPKIKVESNSETDESEDEPVAKNIKSQASSRKKRKVVSLSESD